MSPSSIAQITCYTLPLFSHHLKAMKKNHTFVRCHAQIRCKTLIVFNDKDLLLSRTCFFLQKINKKKLAPSSLWDLWEKKYHTLILPRVWLKTKITQIHALAKTRSLLNHLSYSGNEDVSVKPLYLICMTSFELPFLFAQKLFSLWKIFPSLQP